MEPSEIINDKLSELLDTWDRGDAREKHPKGVLIQFASWEWLKSKVAQLEEVKATAQIIFEVSDKVSIKATSIECPHGNIPSYPSHAWWCDRCFYRLKDALGINDEN